MISLGGWDLMISLGGWKSNRPPFFSPVSFRVSPLLVRVYLIFQKEPPFF